MASACWFRCDLRTLDNPAWEAALADNSGVALFVVSPQQWSLHNDAPAKLWFWRESLRDLSVQLAHRGVTLKLLRVDLWELLPQRLLSFCRDHGITSLHCNREQGINERRRDRACYALLSQHGIELAGYDGQTLFQPGSLKTGKGDYYKVFTPFSKAALARLAQNPAWYAKAAHTEDLGKDVLYSSLAVDGDDIDGAWPTLCLSEGQIEHLESLWPATSTAALHRLDLFIEHRIRYYNTLRNIPSAKGTSSLSPYLAAGLLSPHQCLLAACTANGGELDSGNPGIKSWINELLWREFYRHLLFGFEKLSMHKPLREQTEHIVWRDAPQDFKAWSEGRTGFPIVDAAMRQLLETGWMHNRLRMVVAMFLTKNLLIDWRRGEKFFMQHLIDGDLAANNGGWQWSASTGADAVPYFRVFNPLTQSQKFDPKGAFLRQWLPELSDLDDRSVHNPSAEQRAKRGYPYPIADLRESRLRAIATFEQIQSL